MTAEHLDVGCYTHAGYVVAVVSAGRKTTERIVPPAGEDYAFDCESWPHRVEVGVSPTGRSVRVWVDGKRVAL